MKEISINNGRSMKEKKPTKWEWFFVNLVGVCSVLGAITMVCLVASVFLRLLGCE